MKINSITPKKLILPTIALMTLAVPKTMKADTNNKTIIEQFENKDLNKDQKISLKEYVLSSDSFTKNDLSEFDKYDNNKDNSLDLKEFVNMHVVQSNVKSSIDEKQLSFEDVKKDWQKMPTDVKVLRAISILLNLLILVYLAKILKILFSADSTK